MKLFRGIVLVMSALLSFGQLAQAQTIQDDLLLFFGESAVAQMQDNDTWEYEVFRQTQGFYTQDLNGKKDISEFEDVSVLEGASDDLGILDLDKIEILQFTEYSSETADHYKKHIDTLMRSYGYRKLSFSVQLTNPDEYKGGDLNIYTQEDPMVLSRDQGSLVAFPSFRLHEVTPIESGTRYALVGWVLGPKFK